ncbi:hypothetical protein BC938DRAFT_483783 [Jimgerdemannia flammicorona]|uniref:SH3b domain-containing protein n=1 Tax=Jimgerdemannia flammicorona TaxID=994334 RepID=A0A433QB55_9FUNG|nr:hypothetical protein BC938DRAFT_483783 [Jimgerdemannia flammicorona]
MNIFVWIGAFLLIVASFVDAECYPTKIDLDIRAESNSHSNIVGEYPKGTCIEILCQIDKEEVHGNM